MKRTLIALLCISAVMLTACGDDSSSSSRSSASSSKTTTAAAKTTKSTEADDKTTTEKAEETPPADLSFVLPADAVDPDLSKDDPSDDSIRFTYDSDGRVESYKYDAGDKSFIVSYVYKESDVQIYAYSGEIMVADEKFSLPEFDPDGGFTTHEGFFFKGYKF